MSKIRVHELAKEFSIAPKEMETWIKNHGYPIKNYSSTLEDHEVQEIRMKFREERAVQSASSAVTGENSDSKRPNKTSDNTADNISARATTVIRRRPGIRLTKITHNDETTTQEPLKETAFTGHEEQAEITEESFISERPEARPAATGEPSLKHVQPAPPKSYVKVIKKETPVVAPKKIPSSAPPESTDKTVVRAKAEPETIKMQPPPKKEETVRQPETSSEKPSDVPVTKPAVSEKTAGPQETLAGTMSPVEAHTAEKTESKEEKKHPLREVVMGKREKGHERHETSPQKTAQQPKSYVKIVDRPRIVLPQPQLPASKQQPKPSSHGGAGAPGAYSGKGRRPETPQPASSFPDRTVPRIDMTVPVLELDKKTKKKDMSKRVVQVSEMEEVARRRKAAAKKIEKLKPITKLLSEELDSDLNVTDALLPETSVYEAVLEPVVFKTVPSKSGTGRKKTTRPISAPQSEAASGAFDAQAGRRRLILNEAIQLGDLAKKMGVKIGDVIGKLMGMGVMATINQTIDYDTAALLASEFNFEVEKRTVAEDMLMEFEPQGSGEQVLRPPVVTVMGHVDHGKTSLLDAIREADVVSKEAGGITQHIGAYHVTLSSGHDVVFLDTPGHEAFTAMRARGAQVTDIVILVVAADDGVMAQTKEAIDHAKAAKVPIIVAINKIDKPNANIDRVKRELAEYGLVPEEWGGDTIFVNISAKKRIGIEEFLEMLALQSEVMELKADPNRPAKGHVVESKLDKGRGPVATLLISNGTLRVGDSLVCGMHYGKIRAMNNDKGLPIKSAGPSIPVEVLGLSGVPSAGDEFVVLPDEKKAREVAEYRQRKHREAELAKGFHKVSLDNVFDRIKAQDMKELSIVLKTDVQGSVEAISDALNKLSTPDVTLKIVASGIGAISESDVLLASASNAIVIGFNVKPNPQARSLAEQEKVDIRFYDVIFNLLDDIKNAMTGLLEPVFREKTLGRALVRQVFMVPKVGAVAGCAVTDGVVQRNSKARLLRDNVVVYTGKIISLRRFKEDVKEVGTGYECGIGLERFNDIKEGDVIESFVMEETKPVLAS
ncbi:MAG: translation initiation factor IF-2 [Dissulfuribacterales bacterium]